MSTRDRCARLRLLDGESNVATETLVGNKPAQFPRMQAQVNLRIKRVKKTDDAHVQRVVGHGRVAVLGMTRLMPRIADQPKPSQSRAAFVQRPAPWKPRKTWQR